MKGLVFRELYLGKKNILLTALFGLLVIMIGILIRLSMLYGNMSKLLEEGYETPETILFYSFVYVPVIVLMSSSAVLQNNISSDYTSKWELFSYSSPVSEYRYVGAKFLLMSILSCSAFLLSLVNTAFMCILCDRKFDSNLLMPLLCMAMFITIIIALSFAIAYRLKNSKKFRIIVGVVIAVLYGCIMSGIFYFVSWIQKRYPDISDDESSKIMQKYIHNFITGIKEFLIDSMPVIPFIFIAVMIVLYYLSVKALKRREH